MMAIPRPAYEAPRCPRCNGVLLAEQQHDGEVQCIVCGGSFEARVFHPPQRGARVLQIAQSGPEGATACANHARNAAVAACERCGLLICSLCQLDLGAGKLCPACFERLSESGGDVTKNRFRDYGTLSVVWGFVGMLFSAVFLGVPLGLIAIYYAIKGLRSRDGRSSVTSVLAGIVLGLIAIGFSTVMLIGLFATTFKR